MRKYLAAALLVFAALNGGAAFAAGSQCVTFDPITLSGNYNAFSPSGSIVQTVTLTVHRVGTVLTKPSAVDFLFVMPQGETIQYGITYSGKDVLADYPGPVLSTTSSNPNAISVSFGNALKSDSLTLSITITVPLNANLPAGTTVENFGVDVMCNPLNGSNYTGTFTNAFQVSFTVLSALQASFAGPALDFGEIGNIITPTAANSVTGYVRVASTGPYQVNVSSANAYRMTFPGGDVSQSAQRVKYSLNFLGQTLSNSAPTFTAVKCVPATLAGRNLALTAQLLEGGSGKLVSPNYLDTVTVVVTPLAASTGSTVTCN